MNPSFVNDVKRGLFRQSSFFPFFSIDEEMDSSNPFVVVYSSANSECLKLHTQTTAPLVPPKTLYISRHTQNVVAFWMNYSGSEVKTLHLLKAFFYPQQLSQKRPFQLITLITWMHAKLLLLHSIALKMLEQTFKHSLVVLPSTLQTKWLLNGALALTLYIDLCLHKDSMRLGVGRLILRRNIFISQKERKINVLSS